MRRRDMLRGSALALGALAACRTLEGSARAQAKIVFKASDVHAPGYPTVVAVENLGKKLEHATHGRLGVQMFASMQLGGEKEAIEQAQVGAIQFARVSVGAIGPVIGDLNVLNLPFLFRNTAHMEKVIDGPIGEELLGKVTANDKAGLVGLCWMDAGARNFYDTKHPIKSIADLKGLKLRVIGNPIFVDMVNALGGNGVAMGYDQVFSALQTGVIDGAENNPPSFVFDNHYQAAKFYTLTEHLIVPEILVFSRRTWNTLQQGRPDPAAHIRPPGTGRGAHAVEGLRKAGDGQGPRSRHPDRRDHRQEAVSGRSASRSGKNTGRDFAELIRRIQAVD